MAGPLAIHPLTLREAAAFVARVHRHHRPPQGALFAIGAAIGAEVRAVVIVGRPVSRHQQDGWTCEVTRLAAMEGTPNACSMLYRAAWRAARAMGYRRLITYTLASEPGTSLRAAGFRIIGQSKGGSWSRRNRPRVDMHPTESKTLWEVA